MKARFLTFLIALLGFAGQARADVLYCLEQGSGVLHTRIIAHDNFMAGKRPAVLETWNCSAVYLLFSSKHLELDTDLNLPEVQMLVRVTPTYWTSGQSLEVIQQELRRNLSGRTRVADWDDLYLNITSEVYHDMIVVEDNLEDQRANFVALCSIIRALVKIESDGNPLSLSKIIRNGKRIPGAMGLTQIMPSTIQEAPAHIRNMEKSPFDPVTNLRYGLTELLKKFKTIQPMAFKGNASLRVALLDAQGKVIKINGKTQYETIYIDGLKPDEAWFYTLTAYNRGLAGWFKWRRFNARRGNASLTSDYALKWEYYAKEYCAGINLVDMTCKAVPAWFRKALDSEKNAHIKSYFFP